MGGTRHRRSECGEKAPRLSRALALGLACFVVTACASGLAGLRSEADMHEFRGATLIDHCRDERVLRIDTAEPGEPPVRIAVELCGRGDADHLVVAIHGVLSDRHTWRYMAHRLQPDYDLLLLDLPGCGGSDKPDPDDLAPDAYSPRSMARRALIALRHCLDARGDDAPVTIMAHSLGGAVTLRMLGDADLRAEYADVVERVESVVLLSALDVRVEREHEVFKKIAELSDVEVAIAWATRLLHAEVVESTRHGVADSNCALREEAQRMIDTLGDPETLHAAQEMLRKAVPFHPSRQPDWEAIERLEADYGNVDVPCLILWGARDTALPSSMGYKLQAQLPDARLRVLPRAMHSLPTERPWACAELARDFIHSKGAGWQAILEVKEEGRSVRSASRLRSGAVAVGP